MAYESREQQDQVRQAELGNAAMKAGNVAEVEKYFPGHTLYQGVLVQKSQIPALQAEGAYAKDGNLVGKPISSSSFPQGSAGQQLYGEIQAGTVKNQPTGVQQQIKTNQPSPTTVQAQPFTKGIPGLAGGQVSKYEQGFQQAQTTGMSAPTTGGAGASLVQAYAPVQNPTAPTLGSTFVQTDPLIDSLIKGYQDYFNPVNQRKSLVDTYNQMLKDSGIQAIDTELINTKNIIDGSEDDIRNEITKAGGFATDSAVLALTNARNKQLIKNYNTLLDTRNAKEQYLNTAIQLEQHDRAEADQRFEQSFNMAMQIADYQQKMQRNAIESLDRTKNTIGWDGLYNATQGDPYTQSLVEKTYGLPTGGLAMAAQQAIKERMQAEQKATQENLVQLSEGESLIDTKTGRLVYKNPKTTTSGGGIGGGARTGGTANGLGLSPQAQAVIDGTLRIEDLTPTVRGQIAGELTAAGYKSGPKLSATQQDSLATMETVQQLIGQIQDYNKDGKLEGVGFGTGPLSAAMTKIFGTGSEESKSVRALISNVKGTIAKLRGGTSFTPNEQRLLDSYTPSVNESAASVINKLGLLSDFITKGRDNLMNFAQERKVQGGAVEDLRSKYNY